MRRKKEGSKQVTQWGGGISLSHEFTGRERAAVDGSLETD